MTRNRPLTRGYTEHRQPKANPRASRRVQAIRLLAIVVATGLGCSLLTSLDFVGKSNRIDAGVEPQDSSVDSGDCDESCLDGQVCKAGRCTCPTGSVECDGTCLDSDTLQDAGYCGTCGAVCRNDQSCDDGGCSCRREGETDCGTTCADLASNPEHCGKCGTACQSGQTCIQGACKSSPCEDFCANPQSIQVANDGFRSEPLGTSERCFDVKGYLPTQTNSRIVCWNFDNTRTLRVNGQQVSCLPNEGYPLPAAILGWYCVQVGAGGSESAGFILPTF